MVIGTTSGIGSAAERLAAMGGRIVLIAGSKSRAVIRLNLCFAVGKPMGNAALHF